MPRDDLDDEELREGLLSGRSVLKRYGDRYFVRYRQPWLNLLVVVGVTIGWSAFVVLVVWLVEMGIDWLFGRAPKLVDYSLRITASYQLIKTTLTLFDEEVREDWQSIHLAAAIFGTTIILLIAVVAMFFAI